jgi:hypothetical protein
MREQLTLSSVAISAVATCLAVAAPTRDARAQPGQCFNIKVASQPFCVRVPSTADRTRAVLAPCDSTSTDPSLVWRVRPDPSGG